MKATKRTQVNVDFNSKPSTISLRSDVIVITSGDDTVELKFDTKENFQYFLNMFLMACNQRAKKAGNEDEWNRNVYVYDYEPLNNADLVQNLWESVENASDPILAD